VLEWFAEQPLPAFALFGRRLPRLAGARPDKLSALATAVGRLTELGHRRTVMLVREDRRKPSPGFVERFFLEELEAAGIPSGPYNLPDWEDNLEGFRQCLHSLFQHTPPSALLIDGLQLFVAAQQHLARRGIIAPEHVSLINLDPDPAFAWCEPAISHIHWDARPLVRSIVRWANNIARGKDDRRRFTTKADFVEGGTIGPAPKN
jgi:DNA-binding LacI/PurR family transcriptional regulator